MNQQCTRCGGPTEAIVHHYRQCPRCDGSGERHDPLARVFGGASPARPVRKEPPEAMYQLAQSSFPQQPPKLWRTPRLPCNVNMSVTKPEGAWYLYQRPDWHQHVTDPAGGHRFGALAECWEDPDGALWIRTTTGTLWYGNPPSYRWNGVRKHPKGYTWPI